MMRQRVAVAPTTEERMRQRVAVAPTTEERMRQRVAVAPTTEERMRQRVAVAPTTEERMRQRVAVAPTTEERMRQRVGQTEPIRLWLANPEQSEWVMRQNRYDCGADEEAERPRRVALKKERKRLMMIRMISACSCCVLLCILEGCMPAQPPILVFQGALTPETIIVQQQPAIRTEPGIAPPQRPAAVPDFTTRVRIFNDYNTVTFTIWIDPAEFDQQGNPIGQSFRLAPLLDPDFAHPREHILRLAPGPHRIYFKGFYPTDYHGTRPRQNGWYSFRVAHRDDPCHICLEISTRQFGY